MVDPGRAVPRCVHVPFHVRVISEKFTLAVDRGVILVAESGGHDFPSLAFGIDLGNVSERSFRSFHEVLQRGKQLIFGPKLGNPRMGVPLGQLGLVAHHDVEVLAIGCRQNRMGAVFASGGGKFLDRHDLVELIVLVGIKQTEYTGTRYARS